MEVRNPVHPDHMIMFDTEELREHCLVFMTGSLLAEYARTSRSPSISTAR